MRLPLPAVAGFLWLALSCSEAAEQRAQWSVVVSTDADVPRFGDRLLVEVLDESGELACEACRRVFGLTGPESFPLSFGVAGTAPDQSLRVRARLHRAVVEDGMSSGGLALERIGRLGTADGVERVSLVLPMTCFGVEPANGQSCMPESGELGLEEPLPSLDSAPPLEAGSWQPLAEVPCATSVAEDMVCIPGGVFLLGDTKGIGVTSLAPPTTPERLTRIAPFHLDRTELTVAAYRKLVSTGAVPATTAGTQAQNAECTYSSLSDSTHDALPLNCVSHVDASLLCQALGKRLPTEAEWEFAAGGRELESRYPWGEDDDVCAHAVVSRGGLGGIVTCQVKVGASPGVAAVGSADDTSRDGVLDLGGNLSEWVADEAAPYDASCFQPDARLLENPLCEEAGSGATFAIRGGNYSLFAAAARATSRIAEQVTTAFINVGVRCARSD